MVHIGNDLAITELEDGVAVHERRMSIHLGAPGLGVGASYRRPAVVHAHGTQVPIRDHTALVRLAVVGMVLLVSLLRRFR